MADSLFLLLPVLFMSGLAMALLLVGAFGGSYREVRGMTLFGLLLVAVTYLIARPVGGAEAGFGGLFLRDPLSDYAAILLLAGLGLAVLLADPWLRAESAVRIEFPVLLLFAGTGMLLLVSASNLMTLYIALEMQSLALYVLAAYRTDDLLSSEAGLKYFILGSLASGILLFGASLVYGFTGTLDFATLAEVLRGGADGAGGAPAAGAIVGLTLVVIGLGFKLSASPFHMWTPDVYEGAPTPVTALFAMVPKIAAVVPLARLVLGDGTPAAELGLQSVLWFLAVLSMIWGALAALGQSRIKRLLAYSAIGNIGYALMGLAAGTALGLEAVLVYLTVYLVSMAGVGLRRGALHAPRRAGVGDAGRPQGVLGASPGGGPRAGGADVLGRRDPPLRGLLRQALCLPGRTGCGDGGACGHRCADGGCGRVLLSAHRAADVL